MYNKFIEKTNTIESLNQCQLFTKVNFFSLSKPIIGILVSAECDIIQDDIDFYNFCAVLPFQIFVIQQLIRKFKIDEQSIKNRKLNEDQENFVNNIINNMLGYRVERTHWLGEIPNHEGFWYVDYQTTQTLNKEQMKKIINNRFAKLLSPFKESVYVRYSNYSGRVGLPGEKKDRKKYASEILPKVINFKKV